MRNTVAIPIFAALLFFGAIFWAKSEDPFVRKWFKVKTPSLAKVDCIAVLPKPIRPRPVVLYLHGAGGNPVTDGPTLRRIAELGLVTVTLEYNQTNDEAFEEQFSTVWDYAQRQTWALLSRAGQPLPTAWVCDGVGAQKALRFFLKHPEKQPQLFVQVGGAWIEELEKAEIEKTNSKKQGTAFLLIHGERDAVVPSADCQKTANALSKLQSSSSAINNVEIKILPELGRSLEPDRAQVTRQIGEYIKAYLTPDTPQPEFPKPPRYPFLLCTTPAFLWAGYWVGKRYKNRKKDRQIPEEATRPAKGEMRLWVIAGLLAVWALAETAIHLIPPQLEVSEKTLQIARWKLLAPKLRDDFSVLAKMPIWKGQKLKTLLTHAELANYCVYELINWKLPPQIYCDYVLSPVIEKSEIELDWRRPLWEFFYPRIRNEKTTVSAAALVAKMLREKVTLWPGFDRPQGVVTIWKEQITGEDGFAKIYVASLRSVGIPARLDANGKAEFWDGKQWCFAPRPLENLSVLPRHVDHSLHPSSQNP